jgi:hypothetical protein
MKFKAHLPLLMYTLDETAPQMLPKAMIQPVQKQS